MVKTFNEIYESKRILFEERNKYKKSWKSFINIVNLSKVNEINWKQLQSDDKIT